MEQNEKLEDETLFVMSLRVGKDGSVGFKVDVSEGEKNPGALELVGLLEMVKSDIINGIGGNNETQGEMVEITLVDGDFELPQAEQLKQMGLKVGDKTTMPKQMALVREAILADMANGTFDPKDLHKPIAEVVEKAAESVTVEKEK